MNPIAVISVSHDVSAIPAHFSTKSGIPFGGSVSSRVYQIVPVEAVIESASCVEIKPPC